MIVEYHVTPHRESPLPPPPDYLPPDYLPPDYQPPSLLWVHVVVLITMASSALSGIAPAQNPLPPVDAEAIYQRLQQQDAEIQSLRARVSELQSYPVLSPQNGEPVTSPPAAATTPLETTYVAHELHALKRRMDELQQEQSNGKKSPDPGWVDLSNEKWTVKLGGHVQLDYINWANADPAIIGADNYFNYRRLRLVADGTGYGQFDFRLQATLEPGQGSHESEFGSPEVKDAYLSMNEIPWIGRIRVGNFFVPFSLEQVTNDTNNIFNERSIPTQGIFAADREVGFAFYNCTDTQNLTWTGGVFFDDLNDTIKTRIDDNQGYRLAGRLTWLPYYDEPSNGRYLVHTGVGILHTHDFDDRARFRARPQVQRGPFLIDSGILPAESYTTGNVEFAVVWGNITLQSEAFLSRVNQLSADSLYVSGAYAHLSYFLTGEHRIFERFGQHGAQFGRNQPFTNLFAVPGCIGLGAWEAKIRWSNLDLSQTNRGQYNDLSAGFNWYWSDRTRIMFDWIHPVTSSQTIFGSTVSDLLAMRFDFNW